MTSLILGYGNPLRSDDGFGWKMATAIEQDVASAEVKVIATQQLTPELAEVVAGSKRILFLDAAHEGEPGEIRTTTVQRDPEWQPLAGSHHLTPAAILGLAYYYFRAEPPATLLTVTGRSFELGESMTQELQNAWEPCLKRIHEWVGGL